MVKLFKYKKLQGGYFYKYGEQYVLNKKIILRTEQALKNTTIYQSIGYKRKYHIQQDKHRNNQ